MTVPRDLALSFSTPAARAATEAGTKSQCKKIPAAKRAAAVKAEALEAAS